MSGTDDDTWTLRTKWIWAPDYSDEFDSSKTIGKIVLFRKTFHLDDVPTGAVLAHVSADTRYTLFVNGEKACFGPCRSYPEKWLFETIDIQPLLRKGDNVIAVQVLRYSYREVGPLNMSKAHLPGFIFHSDPLKIESDLTWKAYIDESTFIKSPDTFPLGGPFLPVYQTVDGSKYPHEWKELAFDDSIWKDAVLVKILFPLKSPWRLAPRPIPHLTHEKRSFKAISKTDSLSKISFEDLLNDTEGDVVIPAETVTTVDIDAGTLTTGFPSLSLANGAGATVDVLYAECYESAPDPVKTFGSARLKNDRTDTTGVLIGAVDNYKVEGKSNSETFEPFWMRTFRYIQLKITTSTEPLILKNFHYYESYYPLEDTTSVAIEDTRFQKFWDISRHTLKNCMHETYEDCPYYEQSQFIMDSRSQLLFTYQVSRDDKLARKAIHEFFASLRGDGFMETAFPGVIQSPHIPTFTLFWVLMLHDHMEHFGDKKILRTYFGTMDTVLSAFENKINHFGMVGRFDKASWAFVDWVDEWKNFPILGFPPVYLKNGTIAFISLLYSYVLQKASEVANYLHHTDTANEYLERSQKLNDAVNKHCYDGESYTDGPETTSKCQHTQVFAVLAKAIDGVKAKELLESSFAEGNRLPKCSYAHSFYVFRAFEETELYDKYFSNTLLKPYDQMVAQNVTTWVEDDVTQRSECHGWGASPLYEIPVCVFGIKSGTSGLTFSPKTKAVKSGKLTIATQFGSVTVEIKGDEYSITSDADVVLKVKKESAHEEIQLLKGVTQSIKV